MLKLALLLALVGAPALAQDDATGGMDRGAHDGAHGGGGGDAMGGYMAAMDAMMASMDGMASTGSPDADFLLMMIPHHQSAIDMARVELERGTDEATRAMAEEIIAAQEAEVAEMRAMLAAIGHGTE